MNIRNMRNELRMSQSEFAELLGVSQHTILRWENGKTAISEEHLNKLKHLSVTADTVCAINNKGKLIKISMYAFDHNPPHFHVRTSKNKQSWFRVEIPSLKILDESHKLNRQEDVNKVIEWGAKVIPELLANWAKCAKNIKPSKIGEKP